MISRADLPGNWEIVDNPPFQELIDPGAASVAWELLKATTEMGAVLTGDVFMRAPFGVFFDAGLGFPALMEVTEFDPPTLPALGKAVSGRLWGFNDANRQVRVVGIRK